MKITLIALGVLVLLGVMMVWGGRSMPAAITDISGDETPLTDERELPPTDGNQEVPIDPKDPVPEVRKNPPITSAPFTFAEVVSVSKRIVDENPLRADDEYELMTVTLKDATEVTFRVYGMATIEMNYEAAQRAGFTGSMAEFLELLALTN